MKHILSFILFICPIMSWAIEETYTDPSTKIKYKYNTDSDTAFVYDGTSCSGVAAILDTFTVDGITYSVTSIGDWAFEESKISSIVIPDGVIDIGKDAFAYCSSLSSVTMGKNVKYIGSSAFLGCNNLQKVIVKDIASWCNIAFEYESPATLWDCGFITWANPLYNAGHLYASEDAEIIDLVIPEGIKEISDNSFLGCENIISVHIPKSVNKIGQRAFAECDKLKKVIIDDVEAWMNIEFDEYGCIEYTNPLYYAKHLYSDKDTEISDLVIPNSITTIKDGYFASCEGLTSLYIPNSVTSIEGGAFKGCSGLTKVCIPNSVTSIGEKAFEDCTALTDVYSEIVFPFAIKNVFQNPINGILSIFVPYTSKEKYCETEGWKQFNIVAMPPEDGLVLTDKSMDGVKYIITVSNGKDWMVRIDEAKPVNEDLYIQHFSIPERIDEFIVTGVSNGAFENWSTLLDVSFPETIREVDGQPLKGCSSLAAIIWNAPVPIPTSFLTSVIDNPNLLLYVKDKSFVPVVNLNNIIVDGKAESIIITESDGGNNFYCPQTFTAEIARYEHNYSMISGFNEIRGWESIALPYDVTDITDISESKLVPFKGWNGNDNQRPFWLYTLTEEGWRSDSSIKANTPYIICMPNNEKMYLPQYNINGTIVFTGRNVDVKASNQLNVVNYQNRRMLIPNFINQGSNSKIYALNVNNLWSQNTISENEGSTFVRNLRNVHPFEAYMTIDGAAAPEFIPIFEDEISTGIREVLPLNKKEELINNKIYNLNGQRVGNTQLTKGIYILNGKKVVVK